MAKRRRFSEEGFGETVQRLMDEQGVTYRQLAGEFGISDVSAHAAVNRTTWAHVA